MLGMGARPSPPPATLVTAHPPSALLPSLTPPALQDRIAKAMIDDAEARGVITPGKVTLGAALHVSVSQ